MSLYPRYSLAGSNQFPAISTAIPSQYPVIELVDGQGAVVTNVGNGPADGIWTTPTLANATANGSNPPQYMKDSRGIVHCRGKLTATTSSVTIFTFPVGFRPFTAGAVANYYFHYNVTPHSALVTSSGAFQVLFASVEVDLSLIHFATGLTQ